MKAVKTIRNLSLVAAVFLAAGCGATAEAQSVPTRAVFDSPGAARVSPTLVVAQDAPFTNASPTVEKTAASPSNNVTTDEPVKSDLSGGAAPTQVDSTNVTPVVQKEVPAALPANLKISPATEEIIKLANGGVDESVMLTYVQKAQGKFDLEADEIVYLTDLGVPSAVLTSMLKHDGVDPGKTETLTAATNTETTQPIPTVAAQPQPQPQPVEITTNYVPNTSVIAAPPPVVATQPPQTVVVQQPQTVVVEQDPETVSYFYSSLSPYGSWMLVPDYGWCWQPTVAVIDHGWRPYGPRGNWVWTTSGWYWHSDYTWGWAPFHYGRWHLAGARGWIWVPDRVWGPAWVSWRSTPDYCGWAPLPPHALFTPGVGFTYFGRGVDVSFNFGLAPDLYCFTPVSRFHDRHVYSYALPPHRAHTIYTTSIVHNRYDWGRDHRIVNNGIPRERIERAVNHEIRPAEIRDVPTHEANRFGPREHFERNGRETVIYRPTVPRTDMANAINRETAAAAPAPTFGRGASLPTRGAWGTPAPAPTSPAPTITPRTSGDRGERSRDSDRRPTMTPPQSQPNQDGFRRRGFRGEIEQPLTAPGVSAEPPQFSRRDVVTSAPTPQTTAPTPQISSPAPQISSPRPQVSTPPPQITTPSPRIISAPPQTVAPPPRMGEAYRSAGGQAYRSPGSFTSDSTRMGSGRAPSMAPRVETPTVMTAPSRNYNPAPARPAGPSTQVQPNPAPAPSRGNNNNNLDNDMRNRFGRR